MILKYTIENFRSIYKKREISFIAKNISDHKSHLLENNILPILTIYGSNGGGKSSIIESMSILKSIIFSFNNPIATDINYIKSLKNRELEEQPIKWEIEFKNNNEILKYSLHFNSKIIFEKYSIIDKNNKEKTIFKYDDNANDKYFHYQDISIENLNINHSTTILWVLDSVFKKDINIVNLIEKFKKMIFIINWNIDLTPMKNQLNIFFNDFQFELIKKNKEKILNIFKDLDINIKDLKIIKRQDMYFRKIYTLNSIKYDSNNNEFEIPFEYESNGTKKIFNLILNLIDNINKNFIFIIDELDSGLHTKLLRYIVKIFTDQKNTTSQLIYTSHDIGTLDNKLFRRDEIYFACLNENNFTSLISLYDFGKDIRSNQSYSKIYQDGKIGYEPYIDYSLKGFYEKK